MYAKLYTYTVLHFSTFCWTMKRWERLTSSCIKYGIYGIVSYSHPHMTYRVDKRLELDNFPTLYLIRGWLVNGYVNRMISLNHLSLCFIRPFHLCQCTYVCVSKPVTNLFGCSWLVSGMWRPFSLVHVLCCPKHQSVQAQPPQPGQYSCSSQEILFEETLQLTKSSPEFRIKFDI